MYFPYFAPIVIPILNDFPSLEKSPKLNLLAQNKQIRYLGIFVLVLTYHFVLWTMIGSRTATPWEILLGRWDSGWYNQIILKGYDARSLAFYPAYPLIIWILSLGGHFSPAIVGTIFSTVCTLVFVSFISKNDQHKYLTPKTTLGFVLFMLAPASFIFHSHHTEALFLLLSFLCFRLCMNARFRSAALVAGLCALTRNQGVFVAICAGLWAFSANLPSGKRAAFVEFTRVGLISGSLFFLYPLYQYLFFGSPWLFLESQSNWAHVDSFGSILATLWFGNSWQNTNTGSILHHIWWFFLLIGSFQLLRRHLALGVYCTLSLAVMLLQGELINAFRFSSVLFVLIFFLGDQLNRLPKPLKIGLILMLLLVNHHVTRNYALARWAY